MTGVELLRRLVDAGLRLEEVDQRSELPHRATYRGVEITGSIVDTVGIRCSALRRFDEDAISTWLPRGVTLEVGLTSTTDHFGHLGPIRGERRVVSVVGRSPERLIDVQGLFISAAMPQPTPHENHPTPPARVPSPGRRAIDGGFGDLTPRSPSGGSMSFRNDLWRLICEHFLGTAPPYSMTHVGSVLRLEDTGLHFSNGQWWAWHSERSGRADIEARWSVYQALKPLWNVVDGVEGATWAAMPRDVEIEWGRRANSPFPRMTDGNWVLRHQNGRVEVASPYTVHFTDEGAATHSQSTYSRAVSEMPSILDAVAFARIAAMETTQCSSPRLVTVDDVVALLSPGFNVLGVTAAERSGHYRIDARVEDTTRAPDPASFPANLSLYCVGSTGRHLATIQGTADSVFAASQKLATSASAPASVYFAEDGDTATSPSAAPRWLHDLVASTRAVKATWRRTRNTFALTFALGYGSALTQEQVNGVLSGLKMPLGTHITVDWTNEAAPPVDGQMVEQLRAGVKPQDVVESASSHPLWHCVQRDVATTCVLVVDDIQHSACQGLDAEAAAVRCNQYAACIEEAKKLNVPVADHVHTFTEKWRTRFSLLEVDDTMRRQPVAQALKRGTKKVTASSVATFREHFGKRGVTATEAAKQAGFEKDEVAQHLLVSCCGGLGDEEAAVMLAEAGCGKAKGLDDLTVSGLDVWATRYLERRRQPLETDPTADPQQVVAAWSAKRARAREQAQVVREAAQRARLAAAARDVAASGRAADRFSYLECDLPAVPAEPMPSRPEVASPRRSNVPTFTPPAPLHIDLPTPPPSSIEHVDLSMLPTELQQICQLGCLVDAAAKVVGGDTSLN